MCLHRVKHFQVSSCVMCLWQMVGVGLVQHQVVYYRYPSALVSCWNAYQIASVIYSYEVYISRVTSCVALFSINYATPTV
jgi:hypothetical protein